MKKRIIIFLVFLIIIGDQVVAQVVVHGMMIKVVQETMNVILKMMIDIQTIIIIVHPTKTIIPIVMVVKVNIAQKK